MTMPRGWLFLVLILGLTPARSFAGQGPALRGLVRDATGAPLPGVVVDVARHDDPAGVASALSDEQRR
jgi:hypothetical protein